MEIRRHPCCNQDIGAPADMQDGSCSLLPVAITTDTHGQWATSFWKPDEDELAALNAGGSVVLSVRAGGRQHPVVSLGATADVTGPL